MPTVTTGDGVELSYATAGEGPPHVLFMHGWGGSGRYFDETIRYLDLTRLGTVTFDLRGHRESGPVTGECTLDQIAEDALAVADAAGLEQFIVAGFSMSAKFCQHLALLAPDRIAGQIMIAGCSAGEIPVPSHLLDDWLSREGDPVRMAELPLPYMTQPVAAEVMEQFGHDAAMASRAALAGTMDLMMHASFVDRLASLTTPSLVVGGSGDPFFTPDHLRDAVLAPLAGARLVLLDCGHEVPVELPRELAALIEAFLAGTSYGAERGQPQSLAASRAR